MKDTQTMKKAMRVTMKKMQTIFVRRKPRTTRDDNSATRPEDGDWENSQIEDGLEVNEDNSTEPSPEPLDDIMFSDDEDADYLSRVHSENMRRRLHGPSSRNEASDVYCDQEGACGPLVPVPSNHNNVSQSGLVPMDADRRVASYYRLPEQTCRVVALTSCGELEKKCSDLSLELQAKITVIKETLLREYPPFYDFCVIASDDDYNEAWQFKEYVSLAFGLVGCTLDDGFISLGADLFECYELMMDHSSKVFFFVTANFTSSAFCKRLQSGAVFQSLMSKVRKDREKCVPVFPRGFCRAPLALSGIAGLNPTQREVTRRSLDNTYTQQLRQRRLVWDLENYKRRCLEFQTQVPKCIAEYQANTSIEPPSTLSVMFLTENDHSELEEAPSTEISSSTLPIIDLPENDEQTSEQNVCERICLQESPSNNLQPPGVEKVRSKKSEKKLNGLKNPNPERRKSSAENSESSKINSDMSDVEDVLNQCPIPDEVKDTIRDEIMNNTVSSVNITDCATVHVGPSIQVIINQAPSTDFSHMEEYINRKFASSPGKKMSDEHSDSSDS